MAGGGGDIDVRQGNFDFAPQRLGQLAVGQLALIEIDARGQRWLLVEHPQNAVLAQAEQIGQKRVGQAVTCLLYTSRCV